MFEKVRGTWGSSIGFILASAGAAVGLGNIQRFPYVTAECGGAAFVFIYLICAVVLALPLMLVEFAVGRHTQRNPVCAIEKIRPKSKWKLVGVLGILTGFFILTYYAVMGGWTIRYIFLTAGNGPIQMPSIGQTMGYMALFVGICMAIVGQGVHKGIERFSKIFMPLLLVLLVALVIRALTLPGSMEGLKFYLNPDFSQVTGRTILYALSQAFFSLCIGEAVLVTYGSYAGRGENLVASAGYIALFDTVIAILSGLIVFPALFAMGAEPNQGVTLTFKVLPAVFAQMPFGGVFGPLFFLLLTFAALTTGIALLEIPVIYFIDAWGWKRGRAVTMMGLLAFICGIPSAFSWEFYRMMDFLWGGLGMICGGGLMAIFAGWVWGGDKAADEIGAGCGFFGRLRGIWIFLIKYVAPIAILLVLVQFLLA